MTPNDRVEYVLRRVLGVLPMPALDELRERLWDGSAIGPRSTKYLDVYYWLRTCARRAVALDLDVRPPLRVLDIGTGAAYFPVICRVLGHEVFPTDWSGRDELYRQVTGTLGIEVHDLDVEPMRSMRIADRFGAVDVVTAFMVTFNGHRHVPWGVPEWRFFRDDVYASMRPGGRLALELNREPDGLCYTPELGQWLREQGEVTARWPAVPVPDGHRVVFAPKSG